MTQDYIANCISRILMSACAPDQEYRRSQLLAEVVRTAAREDIETAHRQLINLCSGAEAGEFNSKQKPSIDKHNVRIA